MLVKLEQYWNALPPILVTLLGISMLVKLLQLLNAAFPILVTLFGIIVFLQPAIRVFEAVSIIALHPFRESYLVLPALTTILVKLSQLQNAETSMLVTLLGISMLVKLSQLENAETPILVTLLGI